MIAATYKGIDSWSFNLTRLHARYGKEVTSDLVFRAVEPIVGGRGVPDAQGRIDTAVGRDGTNNFQGRYVILHPWTGAVACPSPHARHLGRPEPEPADRGGGGDQPGVRAARQRRPRVAPGVRRAGRVQARQQGHAALEPAAPGPRLRLQHRRWRRARGRAAHARAGAAPTTAPRV